VAEPQPGPGRGLHHIAYWTDDLDRAMRDAERLLGVGPFRVIEHVPLGRFRFRDEPALLDHSAAFAAWGPVILELNQVHAVEPSELRDALGVAPGAVSHVSWWTTDLGAERSHMAASGCALLTSSEGGAVADWFSGGSLFAHPVEIHEPTAGVRAMWDSLLPPTS
jgi:Glyoxalase/Bleomycin resistance protein/Dioxygenase superfamily